MLQRRPSLLVSSSCLPQLCAVYGSATDRHPRSVHRDSQSKRASLTSGVTTHVCLPATAAAAADLCPSAAADALFVNRLIAPAAPYLQVTAVSLAFTRLGADLSDCLCILSLTLHLKTTCACELTVTPWNTLSRLSHASLSLASGNKCISRCSATA